MLHQQAQGILEQGSSLSFEAGLFCVEPTLVRPLHAFVLESLPAAALLIFYTSTDWSRDQLRFHPPSPYSWKISIHPCGLPSWLNIPPCRLQKNNLIRRNRATYSDYSNYQGSAN